ncbi:MAG: hypothetical protein U5K54_05430 [Cytophagales bacterium]|nr:hypothetical protein [Cytophagales bacterium]
MRKLLKRKPAYPLDVNSRQDQWFNGQWLISFTQSKDRSKQTVKVLWIEYEGIIYRIVGSALPGFEAILTANLESFTSLPIQERKKSPNE